MKFLLKYIQVTSLLLVFNASYTMDYITTVTKDAKEFSIHKMSINSSKTFLHVIDDSDVIQYDKFFVPIKSKNFIALLPLLDIVAKCHDAHEQKNLLKDRFFQENDRTIVRCIKLLNTVNFLNCEPLINFFLNYLSEVIIAEADHNSIEDVFNWVASFDIPYELSVLLGQKIVSKHLKTKAYDEVRESIKNKKIVALAFSADKSLCAYAELGRGVTIINVRTGQIIYDKIARYVHTIKDICLSPDGSKIALVSQGELHAAIHIYSVETQKRITKFVAKNAHVSTVSFSLNSKLLLASTWDNELIRYNVRKPEKEARFFKCVEESGPYVFDKEGKVVSDHQILCKKKLATWFLTYRSLANSLKNLKAEYALLFVMIGKKAAYSDTLSFSNSPEAQAGYREMIKDPVLYSCLKEHVILDKNAFCVIS